MRSYLATTLVTLPEKLRNFFEIGTHVHPFPPPANTRKATELQVTLTAN